MAHHRQVLRTLWLCAMFYGASALAAEPASALREPTTRLRPSTPDGTHQLPLRPSRRQLDLSPSGNSEFHRRTDGQQPFCQSGNNQIAQAPPYSATSCIVARRVETELVGNTPVSSPSTPTARSTLLSPSHSTVFSTSSPATRSLGIGEGTWFSLAAILLLGATLAPGAVVLWFLGLAGILVGGTSLLLDLTWQLQLVTFSILGIALVTLWTRLDRASRNKNDAGNQPLHSSRPYALVGRVFKLQKPIEEGIGILTIGGTVWRVAGRNCAAGKRVKVLRAEGTLLIVDPL